MNWPSKKVRDVFLQHFLKHPKYPHVHVPSSSIVPRNDPSLAFVNAGMNQFKDVILGLGRPIHSRVTNSQKCLRINDLSLVGVDTFHHTFFEMLGNWSFSDYFKAEACSQAWDLLTNVYKLDPNRLYVTYYAGGDSVPIDLETKNIWESMGIPKERVLPFQKDNFWAMGPIGPCGPSTEIHYDHRGTKIETSEVNGNGGNVVEIWNLVFMQYNRTIDGKLVRLPLSHVVDTGAGLERLTAVLNGKVSNYDTDLFTPIFDNVQQLTKIPKYEGRFTSDADLDRSYRIFADHIRAITVALSDGILPQTNHKIRKLIHRSLALTEKHLLSGVRSPTEITAFLQDSVKAVASTLSHVYPETSDMKAEVAEILLMEATRYLDSLNDDKKTSRENSISSLLRMDFPSLGRIKSEDIERVKAAGVVDGLTAYKWYESLGVTEEAAEELSNFLSIRFDKQGMKQEMSNMKRHFKDEVAQQFSADEENNFVKKIESLLSLYEPKASGGICNPALTITSRDSVMIEWIFDGIGDPVEELLPEKMCYWVVLNQTPFIPGGKRMDSDVGMLYLSNGTKVKVTEVKVLPSGWILHRVEKIPDVGFSRKTKVDKFEIDNARRFGRELSAQSIYGLKRWLYQNYGVVRFDDEFISDNYIKLEFTLLKGEVDADRIQKLQDDLNEYGIPLVVTKRIWKKNGIYELVCVTGISAEESLRHGYEVATVLLDLQSLLRNREKDYESMRNDIKPLTETLRNCVSSKLINLPYEVRIKADFLLDEADKFVSKHEELYDIKQMTDSISQCTEPFVVKSFSSDSEFSSLKKITRAGGDKPVLILVSSSDGFLQGRCCVSEEDAAKDLSAEEWLKVVATELGTGSVAAPKGQNPKLLVNLKRVRVTDANEKINLALEKATEYVKRYTTDKKSISHTTSKESVSNK